MRLMISERLIEKIVLLQDDFLCVFPNQHSIVCVNIITDGDRLIIGFAPPEVQGKLPVTKIGDLRFFVENTKMLFKLSHDNISLDIEESKYFLRYDNKSLDNYHEIQMI